MDGFQVLHHGEESTFDWASVVVGVVVVAVLVGIGFGIAWLVKRRREP